MINWRQAMNLYFIAGTQDIPAGQNIETVLEQAILGGISCFQFREKGKNALNDPKDIENLAKRLQDLCRQHHVPFIINDQFDLAIKLKADGVHLGQSDLNIHQALAIAKQHKIGVGLSINTEWQLREAGQIDGLDYVGIGPIFPTQSKSDAEPSLGVETLSKWVAISPNLSKVAIGGIQLNNVKSVRATGVDGVSVISAITKADNIEKAIKQLL